jgi:prevent-host-death family protein
MATLSVTEARAALPDLLDRVERGEEITITRHGRPVAVLLRADAVRHRRAEAALERARQVGEMLAAARERPLPPPAISVERAEELVQAIRADRDAR